MPPIRNYSNWNQRAADIVEQVEPYRKYFFICEGENTETWYFETLINHRKELGIHPLIDICLLEKTEADSTISFPKHLIEFAETQKDNEDIQFDKNRDKMIVVFDADIFESKVTNYSEVLELGQSYGDILAVTNPAFELFLLLHYPNSYEELILPNTEQIVKNEKQGKQTFIYHLLLEKSGMNSKRNPLIGELAIQVDVAIQQEKKINQDIHKCKGTITSNLGAIIESLRADSAPTII